LHFCIYVLKAIVSEEMREPKTKKDLNPNLLPLKGRSIDLELCFMREVNQVTYDLSF